MDRSQCYGRYSESSIGGILISNIEFATDSDIIIESNCINAASDDIIGGSLARDTLVTILTNRKL